MPGEYQDEARKSERRYPNGEKMKEGEWGPDEPAFLPPLPPPTHRRPMCSGGTGAMIIVAAGVFFFLRNLGLVRFSSIGQYWPVILIVMGLSGLSKRTGSVRWPIPIMSIGAGCLLLLGNLHILNISGNMIWPLALVAVGMFMFSRNWRPGPNAESKLAYDLSERTLHELAIFGGVTRVIHSPDFRGGDLFSAFGGIEIDLRHAGITSSDKPVLIKANTMFGGISIKVPDTWRVVVQGMGVFGGYQDEVLRARQPELSAPLLVISGYAVFGGVVVE